MAGICRMLVMLCRCVSDRLRWGMMRDRLRWGMRGRLRRGMRSTLGRGMDDPFLLRGLCTMWRRRSSARSRHYAARREYRSCDNR